MAQVHSFTNPFFKSPLFEASNTGFQSADPFKPYAAFFKFDPSTNPWTSAHTLTQSWIELQQRFWQEYTEWFTWQQQTMQQNMVDSANIMMHCMQLSAKPTHMYRYMRRNWQKPYVNLGAQTLNASRLYTKLMTDSLYAWQKAFSAHKVH